MGTITVTEQRYRFRDGAGSRVRPFSESADLHMRSYSRRLQRAVTDFGSDHSFAEVPKKIKEHYGIELPSSSARRITLDHAQRIYETEELLQKPTDSHSECVIGESDGSMVPIVETYCPEEEPDADQRKHKRLCWKEARLSLAHAKGSLQVNFGATMEGVEKAGRQLLSCVRQSGGTEDSHVHCVGDGASWIANQVEEKFGPNGNYLIDFYHLCEYLSAAAPSCAKGNEEEWLKEQKTAMKDNQWNKVLRSLKWHLEPEDTDSKQSPVRACYRYISNRTKQFDYKSALEQDLPIGSGEVESAHRYVIQARLKQAGAWWQLDNAKHMLSLRTCCANDLWERYWRKAA